MTDRIILAVMFVLILVVPGLMGIFFPEIDFKTTATNTLKKKPSKAALKRYRVGGFITVIVGIALIVVVFVGGFNI
ncbi:hypothetical protein [Paenibacillus koleovorans]|uniref:hypothetical protein n=1 Tax=Paenibacillus koleovorans TaxID=121608 RepID=UPI000FDBF357|nr:hypothetical protein [Paenibacillus koleovorans]